MQTRRLANTDLTVSVIGIGTVKFGRTEGLKYPNPFTLPSDTEIKNLLDLAKDLGINLLDTAPAYGMSEERLGKYLKKNRAHWIVSSKAGEEFIQGQSYFDFSSTTITRSVERSLKRLNSDYLDVLLIHSNGEDSRLINEENVFGALSKLKDEGKIRAYGMSTKTVEGGLLAVQHADVVMLTYHPAYRDEKRVIDFAHQQQKSIFIKKALASGHLAALNGKDPIKHAVQFILQEKGVSSIVIGTTNPAHLKQIVASI